VSDLAACERFYCEILGLRVVWRPDADSVYLTSGSDNLALHRQQEEPRVAGRGLDHIGFALPRACAVEAWHAFLVAHGVPIVTAPRTHRDGSRSLYCRDPDGNTVQLLYEPRVAQRELPLPSRRVE
jgi:catechol-2,3-dioxygenase